MLDVSLTQYEVQLLYSSQYVILFTLYIRLYDKWA